MKLILKLLLLFVCINVSAATETKVILPFGQGGGTELTYRQFEKYVSQNKNVNFITFYKPGASGLVGLQELSKSPKDGSTIAYTTIGSLADALMTDNLQFEYVSAINKLPLVFVTNNKTNISNYKQFDSKLKSGVPYSFGYTSQAQLLSIKQILSNVKPKTEAVIAPYKSGSNVITDLVGGQIDFAVLPYATVKDFIDSNKLKILGSTLYIKEYPNIIEFDKTYKNWVDIAGYAIVLPKDTPKEYVIYWQKMVYDYVNDRDIKKQMKDENSSFYTSGEVFLKQMVINTSNDTRIKN